MKKVSKCINYRYIRTFCKFNYITVSVCSYHNPVKVAFKYLCCIMDSLTAAKLNIIA